MGALRFEISKTEADLELSILELYYSTKSCFREYEKGIVCGVVAFGTCTSISVYSTLFVRAALGNF